MISISIIINKIGQKVTIALEKLLLLNQESLPIYPIESYSFLEPIEANFEVIKQELLEYNKEFSFKNMEDLSVEQKRIVQQNSWKALFLKVCGKEIKRNSVYFPNTILLLQNNSIKTAMFSILEPDTHITPHRGVYKGFLRYHLGIIVPKEKEKTGIRIENETHHWQEGKALLFDDTYEHEAWNFTSEKRIILLIDVERKLNFPANLLNKFILFFIGLSPLVKSILKKA